MEFTIKSHTNPAVHYTVTLPDAMGAEPSCTCKGYGYRRTCSHITEAVLQLAIQVKQTQRMQLDTAGLSRQCACGAPLQGTHALLDKCPACYRQETFHVS